MKRWMLPILVIGCLLPITYPLSAEEKKPESTVGATDFQKEVQPILKARCVRCHTVDKPKAKLDLSSLEAIGRGSKNGAVLTPGKSEDSTLWQMVRDEQMPPDDPLPEAEQSVLRRWIDQGAPGFAPKVEKHWAFVPPKAPPIPVVNNSSRANTDIDRFILAALERKGLSLNGEADKNTLIRRAAFDLVGLPPTPAEIDAFIADNSPDSFKRMVEHYLASPRYGERWGKHWLDVAGFVESNGYFHVDKFRPLAYRYRDYVVRSFNQDKPYDLFVREQLAGDEMAGYEHNGDVTPEMVDLLTATHFLRNGPDGTSESDGNAIERRIDRICVSEGTLQITMNSLLGITIQCARCHEHKFEPIKHEDYYRLQAIFMGAYNPDRWLKPDERAVAIASRAKREEHERKTAQINRQILGLQTSSNALEAPLREQLAEERLRPLEAKEQAAVLKAFTTLQGKKTNADRELLKKHETLLKMSDEDLDKRFPEFVAVRKEIRKTIESRKKDLPPPLEKIAVLADNYPNPPVHRVLKRGVYTDPGSEVQPGVPAAFCTKDNQFRLEPRPDGKAGTGRRSSFARWVTSPDNPLFARVMVNRIWQRHLGVGLVPTHDNFGQSGARPSHPELLDYLTSQFIRSGWSIKAMHRQIMRSAVYRQSSQPNDSALKLDADDRLLWRYPLRRLDAESLRDAWLAVSGELDPRMEGPSVPTKRTHAGHVFVDEKTPGALRRSLYVEQRRSQTVTFLELFDAPVMASNCSARNTSTLPLQSLILLNSEFARSRADAFAKRLEREAGVDTENRLALMFRLACAREPRPEELDTAHRFLQEQSAIYQGDNAADHKTWTDLCQGILASNQFLYVE